MAKFRRAARKRKWEVLVAKKGDVIYVGIDVHKKSYHIAVWKNGYLVATWVMVPNDRELAKKLRRAGAALEQVVYEAGPTGFGLARCLLKAGLPCSVAAPGKTPREANQGNKSDRIDCRKLAEYAAKGLLKFIVPPTEEEDAERQLVRTRDDVKKKRKRTMQQIKSFLLYNSIPQPSGLEKWSHSAVQALGEIELHPHLRFRLDEFLCELEAYNAAMKRVEGELKKYEAHAEKVEILQSHPGVGHKTARQFMAEVYQPERFSSAKQVSCYLGLAPRVSQSGETRRSGGVINAGQTALRSMLIECCWMWIRRDETAHERYMRYCGNTGSAKKAIHAMARCLTVNLWNMLIKREVYRAAA